MPSRALVVSLHIAPVAAAPMRSVDSAEAVTGQGLKGDRYFNSSGTYSDTPGTGRHVTLIESEAVEALKREYGIELDPSLARRNIVTAGIALNHLVEKEFTVGAVLMRGNRLCEPCMHMEKLAAKGAARGLIHRGGLRAEILAGGLILIGNEIVIAQR